jgi:hypothetical protein
VRHMPLASHDARRTGLPRRRRLDAGGGEVVRRTRNGTDRLGGGAGRRRRVEWTEKTNREKGVRSAAAGFFLAARWCGAKRKIGRG